MTRLTTLLLVSINLFLKGGAQLYSTCYVFGTQHVFTFDKQTFDFSSPCSFSLAYTCPPSASVSAHFAVTIHNEPKNSVSRVSCVDVQFSSYSAQICQDQTAKLDRRPVDTASTIDGQLTVYTGVMGKEIAIQATNSLEIIKVTITPSAMVRISVPSTYSRSLCGLCGNYDNDAQNDLSLKSGRNVANEKGPERGALIAGSYLITNSNKIGCQSSSNIQAFYPSTSCGSIKEVGQDLYSPEFCEVYNPSVATFQHCINADPNMAVTFRSLCVYDFCENYLTSESGQEPNSGCFDDGGCQYNRTEAKAASLSVAEVYTDICRSRGAQLRSWRMSYDAELRCSGETNYTYEGKRCSLVCGIRDNRCTEVNEEGCECGNGLYRRMNSCVQKQQCGCKDPIDGSNRVYEEKWLDSLCSTSFTCRSDGVVTRFQTSCARQAKCITMASGQNLCVCNNKFKGDGLTCTINCAAGEQPTINRDACEPCPIGFYQQLEGQSACIPCSQGKITEKVGATNNSLCKDIVMLPDSNVTSNGYCVDKVFDQTWRVDVPNDLLPNGIPFGLKQHRSLFVSTNGIISFTKEFIGRDVLSGSREGIERRDFLETVAAPFWFRQDLRRRESSQQKETKMCISFYNPIQKDSAAGTEESRIQLGRINFMLTSSEKYIKDFQPQYALAVTWHKSMSYPYGWYDSNDAQYATYQAIITTDGKKTFLMFIYPNSTRLLNYNEFRQIFMGYNAQDGVNVFNFYLSAKVDMSTLHQQPSNTDVRGRWIFYLKNAASTNEYGRACISWYSEQQKLDVRKDLRNIVGNSGIQTQPCPCNRAMAFNDERFFYDNELKCFYSISKPRDFFYQVCCYNNERDGALITDPVLSGYPARYHPVFNAKSFRADDKAIKDVCCVLSDYCALYREYRPVPRCDRYQPPFLCGGFGDPHLLTLDGFLYTFNPIGEFWVIKTNTGETSLQARMVQALSSANQLVNATQFQAFAMKSNESQRIHIEIDNLRQDFIVYKDTEELTSLLNNKVQEALISFDGGAIKKFNNSIAVSFDNGYMFRFSLQDSLLSIQSFVPESAMGIVNGLVGKYDNDMANDLTNSSGELACQNCTMEQIHYLFGESWRITPQESLFWYLPGWSSDTYTDKTFRPMFLDALTISKDPNIEFVCGNDPVCMFDSIALSNVSLGLYTLQVQTDLLDKKNLSLNHPPVITDIYNREIKAQINQTKSFRYDFNDTDGDPIKIELLSQPPNSYITYFPNYLIITWTPKSFENVSFSIYAREEVVDKPPLTSEVFQATIKLSPECLNGGSANYTVLAANGAISPVFFKYVCDCSAGWEGESCERDIDGCSDSPCGNNTCMDIPASEMVDSSYRCINQSCPIGFNKTEHDSSENACFDLDECVLGTACLPEETCINTQGSYVCGCRPGYTKSPVTGLCIDIDECALRTDRCSDICINTNGSFECACYPGGRLLPDNKTCEDVHENKLCAGLWNCSYVCIDSSGLESCACPRFRKLDSDNSSCSLFNECESNSTNACDTASGAFCSDLQDGYECKCPRGYRLTDTLMRCIVCPPNKYGEGCNNDCTCKDRAKKCDPIIGCTDCTDGWEGDQCADDKNECLLNTALCPSNSICKNTDGSYECECQAGFSRTNSLSDQICQDINECDQEPPLCSVSASCINTLGSYSCVCKEGYSGDGTVCSNINECAQDPPLCSQYSKCVDTEGSYGCTCLMGFFGDGRANGEGCKDVDECKEAVRACTENAICTNKNGSYECKCEPGYQGDGFHSCTDTDECTNATICSDQLLANGRMVCRNKQPGFTCEPECSSGFILEQDQSGKFICLDVDECNTSVCQGFQGDCKNTTGIKTAQTCSENAICTNTIGSYECSCKPGYNGDGRHLCNDTDECTNATICSDQLLANGRMVCRNEQPGFICEPECNSGFMLEQDQSGKFNCFDVDECKTSLCRGTHEDCINTIGSYTCNCHKGYERRNGQCLDINECLSINNCTGNQICENTDPDYRCICAYGYTGSTCTQKDDSMTITEMEQSITLPYNSKWIDRQSPDFIGFLTGFTEMLQIIYNLPNSKVVGVNIRTIKPGPGDAGNTTVSYQVVYQGNKPTDFEQRILYNLLANNLTLKFGEKNVTDLGLLTFGGLSLQCINITCLNNFTCQVSMGGYPMCPCSEVYTGYNCGIKVAMTAEKIDNLLALWISVAVAAALLVIGVGACLFIVVRNYRNRSSYDPRLHRLPRTASYPRGPAIYNPSSRLPAEAYNYQYPSGSVRSSSSSTTSTSSSSSSSRNPFNFKNSSSGLTSHLGSTVQFAARPKAYSQLAGLRES